MDHRKKKFSGSREVAKKGLPLGLVIALAATGGVVVGSTGTYFYSKTLAAPKQSASPAFGGTPPAQTTTLPPQQQQFTPAPQPPGEVPPGKLWSVEHGHWHDAPVVLTTPAPPPAAPPEATPVPVPLPVTPATPATPAPAVVPAEKNE